MWLEFVYNTVSTHGYDYFHFDPFLFGGRVSKDAVCLLGSSMWSIDELENLHADRTTMFWAMIEAEGEVGYP